MGEQQAIDKRLFAFAVISLAVIFQVKRLDSVAAEHVVVAHDRKARKSIANIGNEGRFIACYEKAVDVGILLQIALYGLYNDFPIDPGGLRRFISSSEVNTEHIPPGHVCGDK